MGGLITSTLMGISIVQVKHQYIFSYLTVHLQNTFFKDKTTFVLAWLIWAAVNIAIITVNCVVDLVMWVKT